MAIGQLKEFSSKEFAKVLRNNNFVYVGCKGSHLHYKRNGKELVVLPSGKCNKMIARRLIKEHKLVL